MLRVYIQGGGCSGFQYGFQFEEEQTEDDEVVENLGVKLLVDPLSSQYLGGRRGRLSRRPDGGTVYRQQPQCEHHVRLWCFLRHLSPIHPTKNNPALGARGRWNVSRQAL